jgi:hypothetical protein
LWLAATAEEVAQRKQLISSALIALTQGSVVRIRWDDTTNRILFLLIRSP